ncbi:MAG: glycosyltransferase family 1 protein [Proteobacteria bacterium]|nr:glycosyltransferase family 1 protein [Pseudomonadota bacterium]
MNLPSRIAPAPILDPHARPRIAIGLGGTDLGRSGIGVYVREVLPRLARLAIEHGGRVHVFGTRREMDAYGDALVDTSPYVLTRSLASPLASSAWYALRSTALAADLGASVILHLAGNRRVHARPGTIPSVAVVHDLAQLHVRGKYDVARMLYARHVLPRALGHVDALATPSRATADDVVACVPGAQPTVIPNGVDVARFVPLAADDPRARAARAAIGVVGPYIVYPARFEAPGKNHLRLVRAFAASSAVRTHELVLIGADWGGLAAVRAEITRLGIDASVRLPGFVDDAVLPAVIAAADAVAMVGLHEGFGLPALEALACGVPVVAAAAGSLPEVLGALAVLADPLDERALTAGIERVLADRLLRARTRAEGPPHAAAFTWDRTARGLFELCLQVMR